MLFDLGLERRSQLEDERAAIVERLSAVQAQQATLEQLAAQLDREEASVRESLRCIDSALGNELESLARELTGRELRLVAVEVLRQELEPGEAIHYTRWIELLGERGITVGGKSPSATLLTQISQAPEVESVRRRSGLFRLKNAA